MVVLASFGGGNMFQSNQAYQQLASIAPFFEGKGFYIGLVLAFLVGIVIIGGLKSIVKVTERIRTDCVFMAHGFGHRARGLTNHRGADDATLVTRYNTDPVMGGTGMNVNFVTFVV